MQSVSQKRVFENAYHTSRLPPIQVVLDYKPLPPPVLPLARPLLPERQVLLENLTFLPAPSGYLFQPIHSLSSAPSLMVRVERLVPDQELLAVLPDVLWRVNVINSSTLQQRVVLLAEHHVAAFVTTLISAQALNSESMTTSYRSEQYIPVPFEDSSVEWEGQLEVTLSAGQPSQHALVPIIISLTLHLRPYGANRSREAYQTLSLSLQCCPAELQHVLPIAGVRLFDWSFWAHPDRLRDCWIPLCDYIRLESIAGDIAALRRQPVGLVLKDAKPKYWEHVEGTLSDLQALAAAYELVRCLVLTGNDLPNVSFVFGTASCPVMFDEVDSKLLDQLPPTPSPAVAEMKATMHALAYSGQWEELFRILPVCLSMAATGWYQHVNTVPGAHAIGRQGIWIKDPDREVTQAAMRYFRDARSTNDTILCNGALALDTAVLFPVITAWEAFAQKPLPYPGEEVLPMIPMVAVKEMQIFSEALISPIAVRLSPTVLVFTGAALEGVDYSHTFHGTPRSGCQRYLPTRNEHGFREQIEVRLLDTDANISTVIFGITKSGAVPNNTFVNARSIYHNSVAITEHINRPRLAKDYLYVIVNVEHCGSNAATSYTTRMKSAEMVGLTSSAFQQYEDNYQKILELRDTFGKQLALDARIERLENDLKIKSAAKQRAIQQELQYALEKRMKKITKTEGGWRKRFGCSELVEVQGNWERRRDLRGGMIFFHRITPLAVASDERCADTCQWEVPSTWDGATLWTEADPVVAATHARSAHASVRSVDASIFSTESIVGDMIQKTYNGKDPAFLEPTSSWAPYQGPPNAGNKNSMFLSQDMALLGNGSTSISAGPSALGAGGGGGGRRNSIMSESDNSAAADRSLAESLAPTIDTANLEHIAEQLLSSDELMRILAKRLGLSAEQVVPAEEMSAFSINTKHSTSSSVHGGMDNVRLPAPRDTFANEEYEPEYDSDDDLWSDDEQEVGNFDAGKEIGTDDMLPQDFKEATALKRREAVTVVSKTDSVPENIPYLDFSNVAEKSNRNEEMAAERFGWRRLPRPALRDGFLSNALKTHTRGPDVGSVNTLNAPVFLLPISPVDACKYIPEPMAIPIETIFIPDAKRDADRAVANMDRNIKKEQDLARAIPSDELLTGEAKEFTSVEQFLNHQVKAAKNTLDPQETAKERAILAAKATNIAEMEDALAADIPINTADEFGNTLLILAAQQGAKRMCKLLLRKGANINMQNHVGNTALHYIYAYWSQFGQTPLGEYFKKRVSLLCPLLPALVLPLLRSALLCVRSSVMRAPSCACRLCLRAHSQLRSLCCL